MQIKLFFLISVLISFLLMNAVSCKQTHHDTTILFTKPIGKCLITSMDFLKTDSLVQSASKVFNLTNQVEGNDFIFRIWVLDPFGTKDDFNLYTIRIFQFGKLENRDTATQNIMRFYASESPGFADTCIEISYSPIQGWKSFAKRMKKQNISLSGQDNYSVYGSVSVGTILFAQQIFPNQTIFHDFTYGYNFSEPKIGIATQFKSLLLFIEKEFGVRLSKFETGSDFLEKNWGGTEKVK